MSTAPSTRVWLHCLVGTNKSRLHNPFGTRQDKTFDPSLQDVLTQSFTAFTILNFGSAQLQVLYDTVIQGVLLRQ